jgi:hypothetical protein
MTRATMTMRISSASLSFVPEQRRDEVLGTGRLEIDDDLADREISECGAGNMAPSSSEVARAGRWRPSQRCRRPVADSELGGSGRGRAPASERWLCSTSTSSGLPVTFACHGPVDRGVVRTPAGRPVASCVPRRGRASLDPDRQAEGAGQDVVAQDVFERAGGDRGPSDSTSACENPGGISST